MNQQMHMITNVHKIDMRPLHMFQQKNCHLQEVFSRELQETFTRGNSFAETYVGVSNIFYVCQ
jgi:hypothetical protein